MDPSRIPQTKPIFESFYTDDGGHLWVRLTRPQDRAGTFAADVFDPEGRYLGQVEHELNIAASPRPVIRGDRFYGAVRDELDVLTVVRFRIARRAIDAG